tara:strand:+ start:9981 stop:12035 length:2055 start_codon:yes stop_codon:yes gene_type:complete
MASQPALREHLTVIPLDLPPRVRALKRGPGSVYWYYVLWQRELSRAARQLHARVGFDVAHHVTFANDWLPCGLADVGVPLVWGPVGGASRLPLRALRPWLGARGTATEIVRGFSTGLARRLFGDRTARRAAVVVAQNPDVARRFKRSRNVVVEPNAALQVPPRGPLDPGAPVAFFVARLLAWKGGRLAIDAIADSRLRDWRLEIFGTGYERRQLERRAQKAGIADRVTFHGHRPRSEVLAAQSRATALLFPSMHDQAGWAVAEASAAGIPVVCLPLGGPPVLADRNGIIVELGRDLPAAIATALLNARERGGEPHERWAPERLPALVEDWYALARDRSPAKRPLRILESFPAPRSTTNPYIVQLASTLASTPGLAISTYSPRRALFGRYDVFHVHWPENLVGGHRRIGRVARRAHTTILCARLALTRTPVVRTWHNLERPEQLGRIDHALLDALDRLTVLRIRLNDSTDPGSHRVVTIPHGHYRDWFSAFERARPTPGRIAYAGLVRSYKGVDDLIRAFTSTNRPDVSLAITGKPLDHAHGEALRALAHGDDRVSFDLRYVDEADLVHALSSSELVALPYRHLHNSGAVLAALSLDRPVLVPDTEVTRRLAREVGDDWVIRYSGDVDGATLLSSLDRAHTLANRPGPDLSLRSWETAGTDHRAAFRAATEIKRDTSCRRRPAAP